MAVVFKIAGQMSESNAESPIISAFAVPSCPARIYVEGRNYAGVWRICSMISEVRKKYGMTLVPVDVRIDLLKVRSEDRRIIPQSWVRLRRGPNKRDLAYVLRADSNSDHVQIAVMPRIAFTTLERSTGNKRKRKPQRLAALPFDATQVEHVHGSNALKRRGDSYIFQNNTFRKGMLILNLQSTCSLLRVPSPPFDEIKPFIDAGFITPAAALAVTSGQVMAAIRPGDYVELIAGEQSGCRARVVSCGDDTASMAIEPLDLNLHPVSPPTYPIDVPLRCLRRFFRVGDNIRVREGAGEHSGRSGCIVAVFDDRQRLTFVEDKTRNTVSPAVDITEATLTNKRLRSSLYPWSRISPITCMPAL